MTECSCGGISCTILYFEGLLLLQFFLFDCISSPALPCFWWRYSTWALCSHGRLLPSPNHLYLIKLNMLTITRWNAGCSFELTCFFIQIFNLLTKALTVTCKLLLPQYFPFLVSVQLILGCHRVRGWPSEECTATHMAWHIFPNLFPSLLCLMWSPQAAGARACISWVTHHLSSF